MGNCFRTILKDEGPSALFKGAFTCVFWSRSGFGCRGRLCVYVVLFRESRSGFGFCGRLDAWREGRRRLRARDGSKQINRPSPANPRQQPNPTDQARCRVCAWWRRSSASRCSRSRSRRSTCTSILFCCYWGILVWFGLVWLRLGFARYMNASSEHPLSAHTLFHLYSRIKSGYLD